MLLKMLDDGWTVTKVLWVDTTKEFPELYDHVERVSNMIHPLTITRLSFDFDYYFAEYQKGRGNRTDERGLGFPTPTVRWCTGKKKELIRQNTSGNDISYVGIAFDERYRAKKIHSETTLYPLITWGMTQGDNLQYCYDRGLDWNGLYDHMSRVSCYCCPFSTLNELRYLFFDRPELWLKLREMDASNPRPFRWNATIDELTTRFLSEKKNDVFRQKPASLF